MGDQEAEFTGIAERDAGFFFVLVMVLTLVSVDRWREVRRLLSGMDDEEDEVTGIMERDSGFLVVFLFLFLNSMFLSGYRLLYE